VPAVLDTLWLKLHGNDDGTYSVLLEIGDDEARIMTEAEALTWAQHVSSIAAAAHHDAMVLAQMRDLDMPPHVAAGMIRKIRELRRSQMPASPLENLTLSPAITSDEDVTPHQIPEKLDGFVMISYRGDQVGQWSVDDATRHAGDVLLCQSMSLMDATYLRALRDIIKLDFPKARAIVRELQADRS
jgi:hypothetical protein